MSQLADLAKPFPDRYVHGNPSGGGSYVKQATITQRLLINLGAYDFEVVQIIRGDVAGVEPNPQGQSKRAREGTPDLRDVVVGAVCRLSCEIDGRRTRIEEVGDCEQPHNWPHDGARLKDALSDALKRCAMRLGLGIHLWAQDEFFLHRALMEGKASPGGGKVAVIDRETQEEGGVSAPPTLCAFCGSEPCECAPEAA